MAELIEKTTNAWRDIGINNMALKSAENADSYNGDALEEDDYQMPQRQRCSCCLTPSLILNVILFVILVIIGIVHITNHHGDGKDQPDLPRSAMQVGEDMKKSKDESGRSALVIDFVVNTEKSSCQNDFCTNCTTDIDLPKEVMSPSNCETETFPPCFSSYNFTELTRKSKIVCENRLQTVTCCRRAKVANNEEYCHNGEAVCNDHQPLPRCLCEPGWTGATCEEKNKTKYVCNCYRHIYTLQDWATYPWCNNTHTEMPPKCRLLVTKGPCLCRSPSFTEFDAKISKCVISINLDEAYTVN